MCLGCTARERALKRVHKHVMVVLAHIAESGSLFDASMRAELHTLAVETAGREALHALLGADTQAAAGRVIGRHSRTDTSAAPAARADQPALSSPPRSRAATGVQLQLAL